MGLYKQITRVLCYRLGALVDQVAELRKAVVSQHQQMFSPPVPDVEVYTSKQLAAAPASYSQDHCQSQINHGTFYVRQEIYYNYGKESTAIIIILLMTAH